MRTQVYSRFVALIVLATTVIVASAQSGNSNQGGQGNGQGQGQNQGGQGNGQGQNDKTKPKKDDPIAKIREAARGVSSNKPSAVAGVSIDTLGPISAKVHDFVTFKVIARNKKQDKIDLVYSLDRDAPSDAHIDPQNGNFNWTPQSPGTFTFGIIGGDPDNPDSTVSQKVTIIVTKPLANWGYDFFTVPRAAIMSRLLLLTQNFQRPGIPYAASPQNAMSSSLIPDNSALSQVLGGSGSTLFNLPQNQGNSGGGLGQGQNNNNNQGWGQNQGNNGNGNGNGNGQGNNQGGNGNGNNQGGDQSQNQGNNQNGGNNQGGNGNGNGNGGGNNQGGNNNQGNQNGNQGNNGQNQNQGNANGNNGNWLQNTNGYGQPNFNPGRNPYAQDPALRQPDDARAYFLGPFDMLSQNVYVPAPERYQLGPGDVLVIRVSSPTLEGKEDSFKVDSSGAVGLPYSGRHVIVRGKTLAGAEALIKTEITRDIRNAIVTVTLKELRTMSLTVLGEAFMPGSYQVPAVATLFNAIYLVGGPTDSGSLRRIELRRNDGTKSTFDLYKFLVDGDARQDVPIH